MRPAHDLLTDATMQAAIAEIQALIKNRFPDATFDVAVGECPDGVYLTATVDVDDLDDVMDAYIDRIVDLHIEGVPLWVEPERTPEREAAIWQAQQAERAQRLAAST